MKVFNVHLESVDSFQKEKIDKARESILKLFEKFPSLQEEIVFIITPKDVTITELL